MKKTNKFSPEVRERAVRMVQEQRGEYPSSLFKLSRITSSKTATTSLLGI